MTQLTDQERISLINDMRSFDEQMPCVGLFWYDRAGHSFFGVRKQEITPQMVEEAAEKGSPFISYPEMQMELSVRMFTGADEPWLYFVTDCRKSRGHNYDLVQGPVANDKVFTTVNLFESGVLSAEAAILQLKTYKTYDQLSCHTARVIVAL